MRHRRAFALASILLSLLVVPASADWPTQGRRVLIAGTPNLTSSVWIFDLPSGDLLLRATGVGGNANDYELQRISPLGVIAAGWPELGASFGGVGKTLREWTVGFAVDDTMAAWQVASNGLSAHLIDPGGTLVPGDFSSWPMATSGSAMLPGSLAPAPGGVYAYWGARLQRMTRAGLPAPGWPANAVFTINSFENALLADGAGGVVLMSTSNSLGFPAAQRFDGNAVRHAGWPAAGLVLSDDPNDALADMVDVPQTPELLPSDGGHFLAAWTTPYNSPVKSVKIQRVGYDGVRDPAWPPGGVQAVAPDSITGITVLPDRSGGAYVLWYAHGSPRGTHVRSDGSFVPGTAGGASLLAGGASYQLPKRYFENVLFYVPADVTPDGRLIFAWDDGAIPRSIRVRWMLPNFASDPSEPAAGRLIEPNDRKTWVRAVHADGVGGAYVAWECILTLSPTFPDQGEVWMTRLLPSSLVGVPQHESPAVPLALSAPRPNPAFASVAFDLSLPDDSPARVELLDVAGRVLRSQSVAGAGPHAITFDRLGSLAPGLYFARATSRDRSATVRLAVSR